jgi:DNA-binding MarR family transcriptional regulator
MKIAPLPPSQKPTLTDGMTPEVQISYLVTIVDNLMAFGNSAKNMKDFGINIRQWRVLGCIGQLGPQTARQMVDTMHQDKATISRAIAELSQKELITKLPNKLHKRSPLIWLTVEGKALYDQIFPIFESQANRFTDVLSAQEKNQLCDILDKLTTHIEKTREEMGLE